MSEHDPSHRFCVAPLLDWTDRHCRTFHRTLSRRARLYTEMIHTGAIVHGDAARHLEHDLAGSAVALQLGGSDPRELALAARAGELAGYDEINLNCGCPSERVQRGAFGACLMETPAAVADAVRAMRDAVSVPVTVKHRIGLGRDERYGFVRDFVGTVAEAGCGLFIVHARNAWLEGLSPKENREVPPLRYGIVHRLAREFPALRFVINGGLGDHGQARAALLGDSLVPGDGEPAPGGLDGVMLGRAAYQGPWLLADVDSAWYGEADPVTSRAQVVEAMIEHAARFPELPAHAIVRHMLGLWQGQPGARRWRQMLSGSNASKRGAAPALLEAALAAVDREAREAA